MKMKMIKTKRNKCLGLLMGCVLTVAGQNVGSLYLKMSDAAEPLFTTSARMEMLEYYKAGQTDSTRNRLGGYSTIVSFDSLNNYLKIKTGAYSDEQIRLFRPEDRDAFLGVIHTMRTPFVCSEICFYDTLWNRLPLSFVAPDGRAWLNEDKLKQSSLDSSWVRKSLESRFSELRFDSVGGAIIVKNHALDYLDEADAKVILPLVNQNELIYQWNDDGWHLQP